MPESLVRAALLLGVRVFRRNVVQCLKEPMDDMSRQPSEHDGNSSEWLLRDEFAHSVIEGIKKRGETRSIAYDPKAFQIRADGAPLLLIGNVREIGSRPPRHTLLSLSRYFAEYCALSQAERPAALERYVERWFILPTAPLDKIGWLRSSYQSLSSTAKSFVQANTGGLAERALGQGQIPPDRTSWYITIKIALPPGATVQGDSMGLAIVLAEISAISEVPMKNGLAVTGAITTNGDVLAVDEVNAKIECWFALCRERGLSGGHGVIIPKGNENDLALRGEIVDAVGAGRFCIHGVDTVDQAIEIIMGLPAEEVHDRVRARLSANQNDPKGEVQ
jgi:hypothetical protein